MNKEKIIKAIDKIDEIQTNVKSYIEKIFTSETKEFILWKLKRNNPFRRVIKLAHPGLSLVKLNWNPIKTKYELRYNEPVVEELLNALSDSKQRTRIFNAMNSLVNSVGTGRVDAIVTRTFNFKFFKFFYDITFYKSKTIWTDLVSLDSAIEVWSVKEKINQTCEYISPVLEDVSKKYPCEQCYATGKTFGGDPCPYCCGDGFTAIFKDIPKIEDVLKERKNVGPHFASKECCKKCGLVHPSGDKCLSQPIKINK